MVTVVDFQTIAGILISVCPWAFDTRAFTEDGEKIIGEAFLIWAELASGVRFQHDVQFSTRLVYCDESGQAYCDGFDEAKARAEKFAARIQKALNDGAQLDMTHWHEIDPAYGSDAYIKYGCEAERAAREVIDDEFFYA